MAERSLTPISKIYGASNNTSSEGDERSRPGSVASESTVSSNREGEAQLSINALLQEVRDREYEMRREGITDENHIFTTLVSYLRERDPTEAALVKFIRDKANVLSTAGYVDTAIALLSSYGLKKEATERIYITAINKILKGEDISDFIRKYGDTDQTRRMLDERIHRVRAEIQTQIDNPYISREFIKHRGIAQGFPEEMIEEMFERARIKNEIQKAIASPHTSREGLKRFGIEQGLTEEELESMFRLADARAEIKKAIANPSISREKIKRNGISKGLSLKEIEIMITDAELLQRKKEDINAAIAAGKSPNTIASLKYSGGLMNYKGTSIARPSPAVANPERIRNLGVMLPPSPLPSTNRTAGSIAAAALRAAAAATPGSIVASAAPSYPVAQPPQVAMSPPIMETANSKLMRTYNSVRTVLANLYAKGPDEINSIYSNAARIADLRISQRNTSRGWFGPKQSKSAYAKYLSATLDKEQQELLIKLYQASSDPDAIIIDMLGLLNTTPLPSASFFYKKFAAWRTTLPPAAITPDIQAIKAPGWFGAGKEYLSNIRRVLMRYVSERMHVPLPVEPPVKEAAEGILGSAKRTGGLLRGGRRTRKIMPRRRPQRISTRKVGRCRRPATKKRRRV